VNPKLSMPLVAFLAVLLAALVVPFAGERGFGQSAEAAALPLQKKEKKKEPKDNPKVEELLDQLHDAIKDRKKSKDGEAIAAMTELTVLFDKINKKQQRKVLKGINEVFRAPRDPSQAEIYLAAAEGLSRFGDDGAQLLLKQTDNRKFKGQEWSALRVQLIKLLGRQAVEKHAKPLIEYATREPIDLVRAAAGEALGSFAKYEQKTRKEIVDKLVKEMNSKFNSSNSGDLNDTNRQDAQETFNAIAGPWMASLTKLTGQRLKDPLGWLKWWNNNKRKNWDKEGFVGIKRPAKDDKNDKKK
jgi:hypothetical protein